MVNPPLLHLITKLTPKTNLSLYTISALLILDSDGQRVLAKYYTPPHQAAIGTGLVADLGVGAGGPGMGLGGLKEQKAFEKSIWEKVKRGGGTSLSCFTSLSLGNGGLWSMPKPGCDGFWASISFREAR